MKSRAAVALKAGYVALATSLFGSAVVAHPLYLTGEIGTYPVLLMLVQDGSKLSGWYFYFRNGKEIPFEGRLDADGSFAFDEYTLDRQHKTGSFKGTAAQGQWRGTWQKPGAEQSLPLDLSENTEALTDLSTRLDCAAKVPDRKYGYSSANALRFSVAKGEVKQFAMSVKTPFHDERAECRLNRKDLIQVKSDAGLLLKARDNVEGALRQCTLRILATANHFYVSVGDFTEIGNDCKAANDTWFCGGHAAWTDLIVDRKRGTCTRVE
jgi:hypothetical protein